MWHEIAYCNTFDKHLTSARRVILRGHVAVADCTQSMALSEVASQDRPRASFSDEISKDPETNLGTARQRPGQHSEPCTADKDLGTPWSTWKRSDWMWDDAKSCQMWARKCAAPCPLCICRVHIEELPKLVQGVHETSYKWHNVTNIPELPKKMTVYESNGLIWETKRVLCKEAASSV